jgi:uncharacterized membrane protein YecN with MAPEG domain
MNIIKQILLPVVLIIAKFFKKLDISIVNVSDLVNHVCAKILTHGRMLHATTMTNSSPSDVTIYY